MPALSVGERGKEKWGKGDGPSDTRSVCLSTSTAVAYSMAAPTATPACSRNSSTSGACRSPCGSPVASHIICACILRGGSSWKGAGGKLRCRRWRGQTQVACACTRPPFMQRQLAHTCKGAEDPLPASSATAHAAADRLARATPTALSLVCPMQHHRPSAAAHLAPHHPGRQPLFMLPAWGRRRCRRARIRCPRGLGPTISGCKHHKQRGPHVLDVFSRSLQYVQFSRLLRLHSVSRRHSAAVGAGTKLGHLVT